MSAPPATRTDAVEADAIRAVVDLDRTLTRNRRTTSKAAQTALGATAGFTLAGGTLLLGVLDLPDATLVDLLALALGLWLIGWIVAPSFTGGPELTGNYFRLHPLRRATLTRGLFVAAWRSLPVMVSLTAFAVLAVAALRWGVLAVLVSLPALLLSVALLILVGRLSAIWFAAISRSRLGGALSSLVTAAIIVMAQHSWIVLIAIMISLETGLPTGPALVLRLLPSSWGLVAVHAAGQGNTVLALGGLLGLAVLVGVLYLLWTAVVTTGPLRTATVRAPQRHRTPALGVKGSELLASWRSPLRVQDLVLSVAYAVGTCALPLIIDFGGLLPFMGVLLLLMGAATSSNLYGAAGTSLWMILLAPGSERADVRGRQAAWAMVHGGLALLLTVTGFALHPEPSLLLPVLGALLAVFGAGAGLIVLLSVLALQPMEDPHTAKYSPAEQGDATGSAFLALALAVLVAAPAGGLLIAGTVGGSGMLQWAGIGVGALTAVLCPWLMGAVAVRRLRTCGPELMHRMQSGTGSSGAAASGVGLRGEGATADGKSGEALSGDAQRGEVEKRSAYETMRVGEQSLFWALLVVGILAIVPQGLVSMGHLAFGSDVTSWFLALNMPPGQQWPTAIGMVLLGLLLWSGAALVLRHAIRRERGTERGGAPTAGTAPTDEA